MTTHHAPFYFNREAFLHHCDNEDEAKETAAKLRQAVDELSLFEELDLVRVRKTKDTAYLLFQFCSEMRDAMEEIDYTIQHAASLIDNMVEESVAEAHKNILTLE